MPNPPQPVGMTLQQQSQPPRTPNLPFSGQDLPNLVVADLLKQASDSRQASGLSETNAKTSETNAKTSETNSKTSETNSKTSETNSAVSETNAYDHEMAAATAAIQTAMYLLAPVWLTEPLGRAALIAAGSPTGTTFMVQGDGVSVAAYEYRLVDANSSTLIASYASATAVLVTEIEDTAANIASAASTLNTVNKFKGKKVWDTTNKRLMRASGTLTTSSWDLISGGLSIVPA